MSKKQKAQIASGKKAVIFARTASLSQCPPEPNPIEEQLKLCRNYARSHGLEVIKEFTSVGSGRENGSGREKFDAMVRQLQQRNCRAIVIEKTDRLCRNMHDFARIGDLSEELDIEIHLVTEGRVLARESKVQDRLVMRMSALFCRNYVENLREEIKKGQMIKAKNGKYPGHAPFGYRNNSKSRLIEIDPEQGPIVTMIFELYKSGSDSIGSVCKKISDTTGHAISRLRLRNILRNRFYLGFFTWDGVEYKGIHEPLVDCTTFDTVQRRRSA